MSSISQANYDAKKYLCVPHDGSKGVVFRHWCDNFLTVIAVIDLKDPHQIYDLAETAIGHDDNGNWRRRMAGLGSAYLFRDFRHLSLSFGSRSLAFVATR